MKRNLHAIVIILLMIGCSATPPSKPNFAELKEELRQAEKQFADSVVTKGFYPAVLDVGAEEVVLFNDGDTVMQTFDKIKERLKNKPVRVKPAYTLTWSPTKIDVAASGDLGYTYGWFLDTRKDSLGNEVKTKGLYCSIWKKIDGKWKLVVD